MITESKNCITTLKHTIKPTTLFYHHTE